MKRIDTPCPTHEPLTPSATFGLGAGPLDSPSSGCFPGDAADRPAFAWESPWIDLGGEG